jgi:hypothetical protein
MAVVEGSLLVLSLPKEKIPVMGEPGLVVEEDFRE